MSFQPYDWNVVVVGHWNRAILTPAGIGKRLFALPEGTPVSVELPIDGISPCRVRHGGLTVVAADDRILIGMDDLGYEHLCAAMGLGVAALEGLPETPVSAAGFNIRFKDPDPSPEFSTRMACDIDDRISDQGLPISARGLSRSLVWNGGFINLQITLDEQEGGHAIFNFHRASHNAEDLTAWLRVDLAEVRTTTEALLTEVLGIETREAGNECADRQ